VKTLLALLAMTAALVAQAPAPAKAGAPVYGYQVVRTYPHDRNAFTQGLLIVDGQLYESTGLNGRSSIRRVDLATGRVQQQYNVPHEYFGEGLAAFGNELFELTWQSGKLFVYDKTTFALKRTHTYSGEGWGLTSDGKRLIMSDGTAELRFLDPATARELGRVRVTDAGRPVDQLNELEYIKGEVWANVWQTNRIARIDPHSGRVTGWLDLMGILSVMERMGTDVLNGIAYDARADRIFVTGKLWPRLFEIKVGARK
jgi:glutamine cyclotransferase